MTPDGLREFVQTATPEEIERLYEEIRRIHASHDADPALYDNIIRRVDELVANGELTAEDANRIRAELNQVSPAAVLAANAHDLIPDSDISAGRPNTDPAPDAYGEMCARVAADSTELLKVVRHLARFTCNREKIDRVAVAHAEACGICEDIFHPIIVAAMREPVEGGGFRAA